MKTQRGIDTHNAILSAAAELFGRKSVRKVTVSDIAKKAGIAKGTFYVHFESKDELVWHFLEHEMNSAVIWFNKLIVKGYDRASIEELINIGINYLEEKMFILKMVHNVKFHSFLGQKKMKERFEKEWIEPLVLWLEIGNQSEQISVEDPKFTAQFLSIAIHDMLDQVITGESEYTLGDIGDKVIPIILKLIA